ncbi:MAG: CRISPR-associated protein Cas4 [Desulfobaccales bacterium]
MEVLVVLAILAIVCQVFCKRHIAETRLGVPVRRIVSADMGIDVPSSALLSEKHRVMGSPDYVVEDKPILAVILSKILRRPLPVAFMPVEVKSARVRKPREGDMFQLLTCCFLLQEDGCKVNRGRLKYANTQYDIPYGPAERQKVLRVIEEMRVADKMGLECFPQANDSRCLGCEFKTVCLGEEMPC